MTEPDAADPVQAAAKPKPAWQPVGPIERRVLGTLVEKAKTTPDVYPMSLNALRTGCNQKNNRDPIMQLSDDDIEQALTRLRVVGAAEEVQGSGRVSRFRHKLYEWLGVEKVELAVMAELLLRGAQTEGELRGRAARMEPIADVAALRPILESLKQKNLIAISAEGRGHVVTHQLFPPGEAEKIRARQSELAASPAASGTRPVTMHRAESDSAALDELRAELADLVQRCDDLTARCERNEQEIDQLKRSLGV